jgi:ABC-type branched-subunit amino acid transport system substrate-binding protein
MKFSSKTLGRAVLVSVLLCWSASAFAQGEPIRIGATIRMLGEDGPKVGQMLSDEFGDVNKQGGINGHKIEFTLLNDECKPDIGVQNALKLISEKKVHLLIGSTCSSVTLAMVDLTARAAVPHITPSSAQVDITKKNSPWIFRVAVSERFYRAVIGKYTAENLGKKIAYIWTTDLTTLSFAKQTIDYVKQNYGVDPVYQVQVSENENDYRPYFLKMKAAQPEVIAFAGVSVEMARMLTQANEVGIPASVARVAQSYAGVSTTPQLAGDAVKGLIFSHSFCPFDDRPVAKQFTELTKKRYGVALPDSDFAGAWDLAQIVKLALKNADLKLTSASLAADRTAIRDALANIKDYQGLASGPISYCADPTPQCRDGNRTPILIEYIKGGKDYEQKVKAKLTFDADFGL